MPGAGDSQIPAGFTYFGQFVDHDITFDRTRASPPARWIPRRSSQGRSPALELDSVYGRGPTESPELYEADGLRLKIGTTTGRPIFGVTDTLPERPAARPAEDPETRSQGGRSSATRATTRT